MIRTLEKIRELESRLNSTSEHIRDKETKEKGIKEKRIRMNKSKSKRPGVHQGKLPGDSMGG